MTKTRYPLRWDDPIDRRYLRELAIVLGLGVIPVLLWAGTFIAWRMSA